MPVLFVQRRVNPFNVQTQAFTHYESSLKASAVNRLSWEQVVLLIVLGYEAAGAILGGILLIVAPDGRYMDMPVEIMQGIFQNFLIPGIILFGLGLLNTFAFIAVLRRRLNGWFMAGLAMGGFLIWFVVEIIVLGELHWLHAMWGLPVLLGCVMTIPLIARRYPTAKTRWNLLLCGILASFWYIAINSYVPLFYRGYSVAAYTVSELSALGARTRILWVLLVLPYPLLFSAFGWGLLQPAKQSPYLRVVGHLVIAYSVFNFYWPPMHNRGTVVTLTDSLHIVWAVITNIFMWLFMGFGAASLGRRFRIYTAVSFAGHIVFGILTFLEAPAIPVNLPTPMIGIWERINILIFMLWVIVFAVELMKKEKKASTY